MTVWNIFEGVPDAFVGQFDIVHIRLVLLVIPNNDAAPVIRHLARMLKPGGYLQWDEQNGFDHRVLTINPSVDTSAFREMHKLMDGHGKFEWTLQLPASMNENGFEDAKIYHYQDSLELAKAHSDMLLVMLEELAMGIAKSQGQEEGAKVQQLIQRIYKESQEGAAMSVPKIVCVARKKSDGM